MTYTSRFHCLAVAALFALACGITQAPAADLVLDHVDIVDVENRTILRDGQIVISGELIVYAGPRQESPPEGEIHDATGLLAVPGFVNAHTHLWQHASRGLETSGDLLSWSQIAHQFLHYATRDEMYDVTYVAARQALLSGFTTTSDFASAYSDFTYQATSAAIRDAGLDGIVIWWNPAVFLPPDVKREEMRRLAQEITPLRLWVAQGQAYAVDLPVRYEGVRLADELSLGISEHTEETVPGVRQAYALDVAYVTRYGDALAPDDRNAIEALLAPGPPPEVDRIHWMRRIARQILADAAATAQLSADEKARLEAWSALPERYSVAAMLNYIGAFDLAHPYVSIHSVWANDSDIALFADKGVFVAHNPESNMRLSSGIAPVWEFLNQGVGVGLGTDGAASNDGINIFSAMRGAWSLQKIEFLDASETAKQIDTWSIMRMATLEAARALGMDDVTGSITAGKQADIVLLSKSALSLSPDLTTAGYDTLLAMVIYSADVRAIDTVISNGRVEVQGGELVGETSAKELAARLNVVANAVMARQAAGKTWTESFDLGSILGDLPWYRYRSIRDVDTLGLTLTNSGETPRTLLIAFSGAPEGGATAPMLSAPTLTRFPLDAPEHYWSKRLTLAPNATVTIAKPSGGYAYTITTAEGAETRTGSAEQLLLLVEDAS